jgi:hypothetical protein
MVRAADCSFVLEMVVLLFTSSCVFVCERTMSEHAHRHTIRVISCLDEGQKPIGDLICPNV